LKSETVALVESYKQKTLAQARLDAKKSILQEREQLIDAAIARAIEDLIGRERPMSVFSMQS
jgi:vacuolar-type H+-ATPase subunit E/Vma4